MYAKSDGYPVCTAAHRLGMGGLHGGSIMFSAGVRRVLIASSALVAAGLLLIHIAGCHTVKGLGRDVEAMGQGGQDIIDGRSR